MKSKHTERSFPFLRVNERESKPRKRGLTEIRGPYYSVVGRRYLEDLFETMGGVRRFTKIRWRLIRANAGASSARYHRTLS
jgi:phosphosulfolactate synthase (CoM biosynthesis protein A)